MGGFILEKIVQESSVPMVNEIVEALILRLSQQLDEDIPESLEGTLDVDEEETLESVAVQQPKAKDEELSVSYALTPEKFLPQESKPVSYFDIFYAEQQAIKNAYGPEHEEHIEWADTVEADTESLLLEDHDARATFQDIQYAATMQESDKVSLAERRRFAIWALSNSALLSYYESVYSFTQDVNYAVQF